MISLRSAIAAGILLSALTSAVAFADGRSEYRNGITAFQKGDFQQAVEYFQQAEAEGYTTVTLFYNMGATHYRLGNYEASAGYFQRITNDAEWGPLAEYNLGLLAERQDRVDQAIVHYRRAYQTSTVERVKRLASDRLEALTGDRSARADGGWTLYISGAAGQDDNPALLQDGVTAIAVEEDTFFESIVNVNGYLTGSPDSGLRLNATLYDRRYGEMTDLTMSGVDVGLYWDTSGESWRFSRGVRANSYWIGGNAYSTGGSLVLQATQLNNWVNLDITNELAYIDGSDAYDFVSGIRNRLNIDLFRRTSGMEWRIGYRNELNYRDDLLTTENKFFSYSPTRHSVYARLRKDLNTNWSVTGRAEYRNSQYSDSNRELDPESEELIERARREERVEVSALLRYDLTRSVSLFTGYRYTDNSANFERFTYNSNEFSIGLDAVFF
jgi:hypothetical protein